MIDRVQLREIDWVLTALIVANTLVGILLIYSASFYSGGGYAWKQLLWMAAGLVVFFLTISIDYKVWMAFAPYLYGLFLFFMAGLFLFGRTVAGSRSWIRVAFVGGQPSELAKVVVLLLLARVFRISGSVRHDRHDCPLSGPGRRSHGVDPASTGFRDGDVFFADSVRRLDFGRAHKKDFGGASARVGPPRYGGLELRLEGLPEKTDRNDD
jgi:hypothetical protein